MYRSDNTTSPQIFCLNVEYKVIVYSGVITLTVAFLLVLESLTFFFQ